MTVLWVYTQHTCLWTHHVCVCVCVCVQDPDSFLVPTWSLRCMTDRQKVRAKEASTRKRLPRLNPQRERLEREIAHNKVLQEQRMLLELHGSPLTRSPARQNGSTQGVRNLNKVSAMDRGAISDEAVETGDGTTSPNGAKSDATGDDDSTWGSPSAKGLLSGRFGSRNVLTKVDSAKEHQGAQKAVGRSEIENDMIYSIDSVEAS
uniref:Uncharacterized protein n=2 Tax=Tetraselmis chuii TaxID=63592 RepID=A0A7S1T4Q7_9CHLO|mmetsp:Transcript_5080/g.9229  ORF Transcript_5080/g.9229 Transcript_5080/m.9229 type:complete len:205 (+) Transcript_5080:1156-1770(+)